ncbi:MAG: flagellar FliJ family protein [Treponema sp.]|nr:flagellar FliJ family protein [Treponema sp.]
MNLARLARKKNEFEKRLENIASDYVEVTKKSKGVTDFSDVRATSAYFDFLNQQKEIFLEELSKAKIVTDEKRKVLQKAIQQTEILKKMKDKEVEKYKQSASKEEDDDIDEMNTILKNSNT